MAVTICSVTGDLKTVDAYLNGGLVPPSIGTVFGVISSTTRIVRVSELW